MQCDVKVKMRSAKSRDGQLDLVPRAFLLLSCSSKAGLTISLWGVKAPRAVTPSQIRDWQCNANEEKRRGVVLLWKSSEPRGRERERESRETQRMRVFGENESKQATKQGSKQASKQEGKQGKTRLGYISCLELSALNCAIKVALVIVCTAKCIKHYQCLSGSNNDRVIAIEWRSGLRTERAESRRRIVEWIERTKSDGGARDRESERERERERERKREREIYIYIGLFIQNAQSREKGDQNVLLPGCICRSSFGGFKVLYVHVCKEPAFPTKRE